uniref:Uncharacterized protein n=1 Tax=Romanomermis culicivorax TaxID=13658 RepID=A0A915JBQ9_ROMCU
MVKREPTTKKLKERHIQFKEEALSESSSLMNQQKTLLFKVGDQVRVKKPSKSVRKVIPWKQLECDNISWTIWWAKLANKSMDLLEYIDLLDKAVDED